ncbi:O-antigen polymerase [uncultured Duncaniella sp.]|uniref:O-antigen polymerase n=1 Tax=uncultured Duncaniella sp. TaxID=2768039 RepID=UPI000A75FBAD|nr:O-antigen polymerase [uncultured Duncaniella sp.]
MDTINIRQREVNSFILPFLTLLTVYYFIYIGITEPLYIIFSGFNTLCCIWWMFNRENKPFTLLKITALFIYVFFILANAIQYSQNKCVLTFSYFFTDADYIIFQIILTFILIIFYCSYSVVWKKTRKKLLSKETQAASNIIINNRLLILFSISATIITIAYLGFNPYRIFFRGVADGLIVGQKTIELNNSSALIFDKFIRAIPFAVMTLMLIVKSPRKYLIIAFLCMFISLCPTGLARNAAAMYWLPIFVLYMGNKLRHNLFMWIMVIGLFFIFPFLNVFRHYNGSIDFTWSMDFLGDMNFDASQLFMAVIKEGWITYGYQLLGPLLFFVPRSIWPTKPIGSGHAFTELNHAWFNNVSMPFFSEGYVNFGFLGIIIFVIFLGWLCAKLDIYFWYRWEQAKSYKSGLYLIFMGALTFILRGDLLSSFAYTIATIFSYLFIVRICSKKCNYICFQT